MYRPSGDAPHFRPVPAAPPPPRVMGGPFISHPPSLPPHGRPPLLGPVPERPSVMQQSPVMPQYSYPPPMQQPLPPVIGPPPPLSFRPPVPSMHHTSLPSMQSSSPSLQRPLPPPPVRSNMPPSLLQPRPLLPQPPQQLQAGFQPMQPSLPSVSPVPVSFQSPMVQPQPPLSFTPAPLPSIQPATFLPPLPPSPPSENPPPPPPPSPPPQSPPLLLHIEGSSSTLVNLLPPEPPKPTDPEMLKNIDVLAAFVVKNGPRFESMARARQAGDPKFAFLFESDAAPEAAIGHEFYKWKKQTLALELGLKVENKKIDQVDAGAVSGSVLHTKGTLLPGDIPVSPAVSDMDMEDDFTPSPVKEPMQQVETAGLLNGKGYSDAKRSLTVEGFVTKTDAEEQLVEGISSPVRNNGICSSTRLKTGDQMPEDGRRGTIANSVYDMDPMLKMIPISSSEKALLDTQSRSERSEALQDPGSEHQENHMERVSRWECLLDSHMDAPRKGGEDHVDRFAKNSSSPGYDNSLSADRNVVKVDSNVDIGNSLATSPARQDQETVSVDEFGRLIRKEAVESDFEEDNRPRKRRRGYSRSRSRSRSMSPSRGRSRSRSRSRNRNRSRSRSRSRSYSPGQPRWKRQAFSRSPTRRGRRSRSRSRSPHWQRNDSRSPPRDRWGGAGRGDRDWRGERESFGRGRRGGRGSGPSVCFHYARGRCFRGSACKFLHPERETVQDRDMQLADTQASGFKDVEPTRGSADPGLHSMQGHMAEDTAHKAVSARDRTDPSQLVDQSVGEEGCIQAGQPTSSSRDHVFGTVKQEAKPFSDEVLEIEVGVDEPEIAEATKKEPEIADATKNTRFVTELRKSDNEQSGSAKDDLNVREHVEVEESNRRDTVVNEAANEESENKTTDQVNGQKKVLMPTDQRSNSGQVSESAVYEKDKVQASSHVQGTEIKAEKPDLLSGLEMSDFEEITPPGSAEVAVGKSGVEGDFNSLRTPHIPGASLEGRSSSPTLTSEVKVMTKVMHVASPSIHENLPIEQSVLGHKTLDPVHYSPPASGTNLTIRNSFPISSLSLGQQVPFSNPPLHASLHDQSKHGASPLIHRGSSDITRQHSLLVTQERAPNFDMHHSGQFASNLPMLQQLGNRSQSVKEPWNFGGSFSVPKEEPTYSRLFDNNGRQYTHSGPSGDVLRHAYSTSNIMTSAASTHNSFSWNESTSVASRSMLSSNADQAHYSYTLTTIPPLPSLIKLPGVSNESGSNEQYDPLSDGLDLGSLGGLKSSSKSSAAERPVGAGFLENLSPGLDAEKATVLALATDADAANMNEATADVGVVENVSPPGEWSPVQPGDGANVVHDHSKNKKSNRGLKLLRTAVADRVKVLLKPAWKEGRLSKDAFKTIAKKAVEKVTGNLPNHHIPKSQEKVDQYMAVSGSKISRLVQGYIDKYSKAQG